MKLYFDVDMKDNFGYAELSYNSDDISEILPRKVRLPVKSYVSLSVPIE
jgi:hypothetical protein